MGFRLKESTQQRDAESAETIRTPDGGTAQVNKGDKVYEGENGWVYHHPAEDDEGNPITPDWEEVAKSHSNPALVSDLLESGDDSDDASSTSESGSDDEDSDELGESPFSEGPASASTPRRRAGDK